MLTLGRLLFILNGFLAHIIPHQHLIFLFLFWENLDTMQGAMFSLTLQDEPRFLSNLQIAMLSGRSR